MKHKGQCIWVLQPGLWYDAQSDFMRLTSWSYAMQYPDSSLGSKDTIASIYNSYCEKPELELGTCL